MNDQIPKTIELNNGTYTICNELGRGSTCIAYLAEHDGQKCIVKEFFPRKYSLNRDKDGFPTGEPLYTAEYKKDLDRFIDSAKIQKQIRNNTALTNSTPYIIEIYNENNVGYICVANSTGDTFEKRFKHLNLEKRISICLALTKTINAYHENGFICLDIKPSNIFILNETIDLINYIDYDSIKKKSELKEAVVISSTPDWCAPEVSNRYSFNTISEKTDIYTLGEMIFYSVFERHSEVREHRSFSKFPFEECRFEKAKVASVKRILSEIFSKSLRSSPQNRYDSTSELIDALELLKTELSKEYQLVDRKVTPIDYFIGREQDLIDIKQSLDSSHEVFITGIGGIGKSEIARKYAADNRNRYDNIIFLTYDHSFERTFYSDTELRITNLSPYIEESEAAYCNRKIDALDNILGSYKNQRNLIILDDMNDSLSEISDNELWKRLQKLNADLIITTRQKPGDRKCVEIKALSENDELHELFCHYAEIDQPESDNCEEYISRIIDISEKHTLLVELIAKYMKASFLDPEKLFLKLKEHGFLDLDSNKVGYKDINDRISGHIERLFNMNQLDNAHLMVLAELAVLPKTGVNAYSFTQFWGHEDNNILNELISSGWIRCNQDTLSIHEAIRIIVIDMIKLNRDIYDKICIIASVSMFKNNSYSVKYSHTFNSLKQKNVISNEDFDKIFESEKISQPENLLFCNSISKIALSQTFTQHSINYLCYYLQCFIEYQNYDDSLMIIKKLLNKIKDTDKNYAIIDWLYYYKFKCIKYNTSKNMEEMLFISNNRYKKAKKKKKYIACLTWCFFRFEYLSLKLDLKIGKGIIPEKVSLLDYIKILFFDIINLIPLFWYYVLSSALINKGCPNHYLEIFETLSFIFDDKKCIPILESIRKTRIKNEKSDKFLPTYNSTKAHMIDAYIVKLKNNTSEAIKKLISIIDYYENYQYSPNTALLEAIQLVAEYLFETDRAEESEKYFNRFIETSEELQIKNAEKLQKVHFYLGLIAQKRGDLIKVSAEIENCCGIARLSAWDSTVYKHEDYLTYSGLEDHKLYFPKNQNK